MQYTLNTPLTKDKLQNLQVIMSASQEPSIRREMPRTCVCIRPWPNQERCPFLWLMPPFITWAHSRPGLSPSGVCRGTAFPMYRGVQGYCLRGFGYSGSPPAHCEGFPYDRNY